MHAVIVQTQTEDVCIGKEDFYMVNNPINCAAHWVCFDEMPLETSCDEGFNFNEAEQLCDDPDNFPCIKENESICKGLENGHFLNNPASCRAYWLCWEEEAFSGECKEGLNFNEADQLCDNEENYPCANTEPMCPNNNISFFEVENSCTEFNFCFAGSHTILSCAVGLHFDSKLNTCNFPSEVNCTRDMCPAVDAPGIVVTHPSPDNCNE